jgi:uncharacterized protein (TIGR03905 family)
LIKIDLDNYKYEIIIDKGRIFMIEYKTRGVCARKIQFMIEDGILKDVSFTAGCNGNLSGISKLVEGMKIEDVINKLEGIKCGGKNTSCPAQLVEALKEQLKSNK